MSRGLLITGTACIALFNLSNALAVNNIPAGVEPGVLGRQLTQEPFRPRLKPAQIQSTITESAKPIPGAEKIKFLLKKLIIEGNKSLSYDQLLPIFKDKLNKTISVADLQAITKSISASYRKAGYLISVAIIPPQEIVNGAVKIKVVEGFVDHISVEGNPSYANRKLLIAYAKRIQKSNPLKSSVLERYALLADDMPGTNVRFILAPSKKTQGAADLKLVVNQHPISIYASTDNHADRNLGRVEGFTGGFINGAFQGGKIGLQSAYNDKFWFVEFRNEQQVGSDGLDWDTSYSLLESTPNLDSLGESYDFNFDGQYSSFRTRLSYPIIRSRRNNLWVHGQFDTVDSNTDLITQNLFEDHIRSLRGGIDYENVDSWQGVNIVGVDFAQGLRSLGADSPLPSRPNGKLNYSKFDGFISRLQHLPKRLSALLSLSGQYSFNSLLSAEQFTFGGIEYGRGYDPATLIGDQGIEGKAELRYTTPGIPGFIRYIQFFGFYDAGEIWNRDDLGQIPTAYATSVGAGVRISFAHTLYAQVEFGQPISATTGIDKGNHVYFTLAANLFD